MQVFGNKKVGTPDAGAAFRVISEHKVDSIFIAPTALRAIHQQDQEAKLGKKYPIEKLYIYELKISFKAFQSVLFYF